LGSRAAAREPSCIPAPFAQLEYVARAVKNPARPFGGMQIVLAGDFFQLPPVQALIRLALIFFTAKARTALVCGNLSNSLSARIGILMQVSTAANKFAFESPAWRKAQMVRHAPGYK
jgi:hypothetical protein